MSQNKLTFKTKRVEVEQGGGSAKYLAFYFFVDGEEIGKGEYNPADYDDISASDFSDNGTVFIQHCGCGERECSALVANVKYLPDDVVEWRIDEYRYSSSNAEIYHFAKEDYEKIAAQICNAARLEEAEIFAEANKTFFLKMEPDIFALFWNDNPDNWRWGFVYGDDESVSFPKSDLENAENDDDEIRIEFNSPELSRWLSEYVNEVLIPCEAGEVSVEELNKTFDWKSFHRRGIRLAVAVKKLLPKNVVLKYSAPFEDRSSLLTGEILIDDNAFYVQDILEKLF